VGRFGVCSACWVGLRFGVGALRMAWHGMAWHACGGISVFERWDDRGLWESHGRFDRCRHHWLLKRESVAVRVFFEGVLINLDQD
jgi:hypothetical protein